MSAHEQFADDLASYALGSLQGSERAALQAHLADCAACRRELEHLCSDMGLLGLATISVVLWRQNNALRQDLAQQLKQSGQNQTEVESAREVLALLSAPDAIRVTLIATNAKPQPQGKAIYRPQTGSLVFLATNFSPLPSKKAYELWLVPTSGAPPIPIGVFKPDSQGSATVLMPPLPKDLQAKAFAITVEPETGSTSPTMPIILAGEA